MVPPTQQHQVVEGSRPSVHPVVDVVGVAAPGRVVAHRHDAGVARQPLRRFRGNADRRVIDLQHAVARHIGRVGARRGLDVQHHRRRRRCQLREGSSPAAAGESDLAQGVPETLKELLAVVRLKVRLRPGRERRRPDGHAPPGIANVTRDYVPAQMRHHVAERLDVDVVGLSDVRDRVLCAVEVGAECSPLPCRGLVRAHATHQATPELDGQLMHLVVLF